MKQYSIFTLLLTVTLSAVAFAYASRPSPTDKLHALLRSNTTDKEKLDFVSRYIAIGDDQNAVIDALQAEPTGWSCGFTSDLKYYDCGLQLVYGMDGKLRSIGYDVDDATGFHLLASTPVKKHGG